MAYVPLFCQSHHSPQGVAAASELARRARALGYTTLGICDEGTIAGFAAFDAACRKEGIRPIFGCRLPVTGLGAPGRAYPVDLLVETEQGYRNLVRLLTAHHARGEGERRPLTQDDLRDHTGGLTAAIPPEGELGGLIASRDTAGGERFLETATRLFGAGLTLLTDAPREGGVHTIETGRKILQIARWARVTAGGGRQVKYPEPGDAAAAVFLESRLQPPGRAWTPPADAAELPALWPEQEMLAQWPEPWHDLPHATGEIARRCAWRPSRIRRAFPTLDLERGFDPASYLFDLVIRGATQQYGEINETLKQRINREFEEVRQHNLAPYLLLCAQISKALDEKGVSRGVGRGRLVASVLAYSLGITRIDPLQYNLMAKSLVGEGETSPAIVVEIPRGGAPALLDWLRESFGEGRLAEIGRIQETRRDQMINELAEWAGMTDEEKRLAHRQKARLRSAGAAQRLSDMTQAQRSRRWRDPAFIGDLAARLAPRPRTWTAPGDRFALCGEPMDAIAPLVRSMQERPVTGLEEGAIDRIGLARIVLAPHGMLDLLDQAMEAARAQHNGAEFRTIPLDDRAAYDLLARGDTTGIPPLEEITMRTLLRKHAPRNLLQLLRVKTEAAAKRAAPAGQDLSAELPDMLLSYQCAWLKANHPLAFYAAAMSAASGGRGDAQAISRAARRAGHAILSPDINLSDWDATIQSGAIRLGLGAVKGFGQKAWDHLCNVRSGGAFESLQSFCDRVDLRLVPPRTIRMLIAAGALDKLGGGRAAMDASAALLQKKARDRDAAEGAAQSTLFDLEAWREGEEPAAAAPAVAGGELAEWNDRYRVEQESDALGFALSLDPVKRYGIANARLRPLQIEELTARKAGRHVRVAGLVRAIEREGPLIAEAGDALIDLEGIPVHLSGRSAATLEQNIAAGDEALAIGRLERNGGAVSLHAEGIWRLADLEDQATRVMKVRLGLQGENKPTLKLLLGLAAEFPGESELELAGYEGRKGWTYGRLARRKVFFCSPLYQGLCKVLPMERIDLFAANGAPFAIHATPAPEAVEEEEEMEAPEEEAAQDEAVADAGKAEGREAPGSGNGETPA